MASYGEAEMFVDSSNNNDCEPRPNNPADNGNYLPSSKINNNPSFRLTSKITDL